MTRANEARSRMLGNGHVRFWRRAGRGDPPRLAIWAHRQREDGKRTPAEVLDRAVGHSWAPAYLPRVFFTRRFARWLDRLGYLRFRQWHLYGEEGLARQAATAGLHGKTLTIEFANAPLTQFAVAFQPDQKRFRTVKLLHRFETHYRSPQRSLWSEEDVTWLLAWKAQDMLRRKIVQPVPTSVIQPPFFQILRLASRILPSF